MCQIYNHIHHLCLHYLFHNGTPFSDKNNTCRANDLQANACMILHKYPLKTVRPNLVEYLIKQLGYHLPSACQLSTASQPKNNKFLLHYPVSTKPANKKMPQQVFLIKIPNIANHQVYFLHYIWCHNEKLQHGC